MQSPQKVESTASHGLGDSSEGFGGTCDKTSIRHTAKQ